MNEDDTVLRGFTGATPVRPGQPGRSTKVQARPLRQHPSLCCPQAGPLGSSQHRETRDTPEEARNGPKGQDQKSAAGDHQCFYTRASCGPCILDWPPSAQHRPKARSLPPPSLQGWTQPRARGHFRRLSGGVETFKPNINS